MALFSLEMSEGELAQRFIASRAKINGESLRKGRVKAEQWPKVLKATEKLTQAPLFVDDSSDLGVLELRAKARRLHQRHPLGLLIIDYLQLMRPEDPRDGRVEQVGKISRGLKILARELDIPVIAISQLSRAVESRPDKRPMMADLRESGNIEQDADLVMFVYRDEYYNPETTEKPGVAEVIIGKHRNGPVGLVELTFLEPLPEVREHRVRARPRAAAMRRTGPAEHAALRPGPERARGARSARLRAGHLRRQRLDPRRTTTPPCPARCRERHDRPRRRASGMGTGIPKRFRGVSFDRKPIVRPRPVRAAPCPRDSSSSIEHERGRRHGALVRGRRRHGQDVAGHAGVARPPSSAGRSVAIYPVTRLLAEIKDTYDRETGGSYMSLFRRLCAVDLLHLDDLGAEKRTDWVLEQLYSIVNERWQDERSIVVTTNITDMDELREQVGARTVSRLPRSAASRSRSWAPDLRVPAGA